MESADALWGGAAVRGQVFPSTDANDASEEELEAESCTRGERRGAHSPRILASTRARKQLLLNLRLFHNMHCDLARSSSGTLLNTGLEVPESMSGKGGKGLEARRGNIPDRGFGEHDETLHFPLTQAQVIN